MPKASIEVEYIQYKKNDYESIRECQRLVGPTWTAINGQHGFRYLGSKVLVYENEYIVKFPDGSIDVFKAWNFFDHFTPIAKKVPVIKEPTVQVNLDLPLAHNMFLDFWEVKYSPKDPYQISLDDIMKAEEYSIDALARQMSKGNFFGGQQNGR